MNGVTIIYHTGTGTDPALPSGSLGSLAAWKDEDLCGQLAGRISVEPDYSELPSTPDQLAIVAYLDAQDLRECCLLHVGVGNSNLAQQFHERCELIHGLTITPGEHLKATGLGLPRYQCWLCDKFDVDLASNLASSRYDFIVDNNLASFACCRFHFARMMDTYRHSLKPGGRIITHKMGMDWTAADVKWRMTVPDLRQVATRFGLSCRPVGHHLYALRRPEGD